VLGRGEGAHVYIFMFDAETGTSPFKMPHLSLVGNVRIPGQLRRGSA
jgi:hypothetical protein